MEATKMGAIAPSLPIQPYLPHNLSSSLHPTCKTLPEVKQLHAASLKTGTFNHPSRLVSLYADRRINNLDYARSVFDRLPYRTLSSWNNIIKCYVHNHFSNDAIALFCESLGEFLPDNFTLPCVIKGCAQLLAKEEGRQIHGLSLKIGFGLEKFVQSSLVSMYSKCGEIELARKVFDRMDDKDLVSWNAMIDGYAKCGEMEVALKLFDEMSERDSFSWTVLVDGFSKSGKVEAAREIFDKMPCRNLVSWNAMINGYMKCGYCESALQLFNQMPVKDLVTWNSMITGYESNGKPMEALKLFTIMLNDELAPDDATFVGALSAVSKSALLSKGRWMHSYLTKNGFQLDGIVGTSLIDMYTKCGSIECAQRVFQAIPEKRLSNWNAIIYGLGIHGMGHSALELFSEMCRMGMKPDEITFVGVLNACSHTGLVEDGRRYFKMMVNDYGIQPDIELYGCLVDILCRAGYLEEAKDVIDNMRVSPSSVIWMSLLSGSRTHRNPDICEYAANHLIEVAPESIARYVVLSNAYSAAGRWDKVSEVQEMKREAIKYHECSFIEHRGVAHEFVVGDKSHPQTEGIDSKLREMHDKLKLAGHVPDTTQARLCIEDDEKKKEAELENHSERLAIAYGLINMEPGTPIRVIKNLGLCNDCHSVTKLLSHIYNREIVVRDNGRFHHFKNGSCSCKEIW